MAIAGIGFNPNYRAQSVQRQNVSFQANKLMSPAEVEALRQSVAAGKKVLSSGDAVEQTRKGLMCTPCLSRTHDQITQSREVLAGSVIPSKKL